MELCDRCSVLFTETEILVAIKSALNASNADNGRLEAVLFDGWDQPTLQYRLALSLSEHAFTTSHETQTVALESF